MEDLHGYTTSELEEFLYESESPTIDDDCDCMVEPDGICEHGSKSVLLALGWI